MRARQAHCGPCEREFTLVCAAPDCEKDVPATIHQKVNDYILAEMLSILECDFNSSFDVCQVW